ncbi:alpha/beta fold hydrolase [Methylolobus aquaticus]
MSTTGPAYGLQNCRLSPTEPEELAVTLHSRAYGTAGPPVVILHGLLGSHRNWRSIAQSLAADHRVHAADLRNHGESPHSDQMDYPHLTADVARLLHGLEVERVRLIGHSLGGKVAMCLALAEPHLVESVAIVDMAPVAYPNRNAPILDALRNLPLAELSDRRSADRQLAETISDASLRQFLLTNLVQTRDGFSWQPNIAVLASAGPVLSDFPTFSPETAFPGPALFISGALSPYRVRDHRDAIGTLFPEASHREIAGAGHWPHVESPTEFLSVLRDFLTEPS